MGLIAENKVVENQASQDVHVLPAPFSVPPTIRSEPAGQRQQALPGAGRRARPASLYLLPPPTFKRAANQAARSHFAVCQSK